MVKDNCSTSEKELSKIAISNQRKIIFIDYDDIILLKSQSNYTKFYLINNEYEIVSRTLGDYEKLLPNEQFIRMHDKYIINLHKIKSYHRNESLIYLSNNFSVNLSQRKKDEFLTRFEKWIKK